MILIEIAMTNIKGHKCAGREPWQLQWFAYCRSPWQLRQWPEDHVRMKTTLIKESHYIHTIPLSIFVLYHGNNVTRSDIYTAPLTGTFTVDVINIATNEIKQKGSWGYNLWAITPYALVQAYNTYMHNLDTDIDVYSSTCTICPWWNYKRARAHTHKHVSIQLIIYTQALSVRIVRIKWLLHVYDTMGTAMSIVHM